MLYNLLVIVAQLGKLIFPNLGPHCKCAVSRSKRHSSTTVPISMSGCGAPNFGPFSNTGLTVFFKHYSFNNQEAKLREVHNIIVGNDLVYLQHVGSMQMQLTYMIIMQMSYTLRRQC